MADEEHQLLGVGMGMGMGTRSEQSQLLPTTSTMMEDTKASIPSNSNSQTDGFSNTDDPLRPSTSSEDEEELEEMNGPPMDEEAEEGLLDQHRNRTNSSSGGGGGGAAGRNSLSSSSSGSSFDFGDIHAFPLSLSIARSPRTPNTSSGTDLAKTVTLFNGVALIIGMCIGSGIFASPGPVFMYTQSVGGAILVWIAGGVLAITGALCYAELGTMMPTSGGEHPYLMRAYGSLPAFLFAWTGITVTRPGSVAIICVTFADYFGRLLYYAIHFNDTNAEIETAEGGGGG
ncbi:b(0,+)-type amino acid transporter 1, partial [Quaeritorhiza haematococci]